MSNRLRSFLMWGIPTAMIGVWFWQNGWPVQKAETFELKERFEWNKEIMKRYPTGNEIKSEVKGKNSGLPEELLRKLQKD